MNLKSFRSDHGTLHSMIGTDFNELTIAAKNLASHTFTLTGLRFGTSVLEWVASIAAIYLVLDQTNWKTNMLTSLLIRYIIFTAPSLIFGIFRGEIGKWIAFVAAIVQLFFPKQAQEYLELPVALVLIALVAPNLIAGTFKDS
ncbi:PREDICTED: cold-regulated 413 plasma membrane protein 1-like [Camelina sativa]|uniref:Cold-regulated 413 plasma membrane protein 1-like n=1 Tax=Camelina sativa TaxID=90675 RepID=A0ABM1R065_CAMSA|nr:PREDICTED: cold-regulated 413 plasma membrane protein 1-like [Camelina sativa]